MPGRGDGKLRDAIERVISSPRFHSAVALADRSGLEVADDFTDPGFGRETGDGSEGSHGGGGGDPPGSSTIAKLKQFIAVLDKVYAKVLTDGDFDFVGFMRARGLGASEMVDVLEGCAVRLGEEWGCDTKSFVRVTVAMSRLQRILTALGQENRCFEPFNCEHSALFIVPRGETHLFAVGLMEERFRLEGWETRLVIADRSLDLENMLKTSDYALVCVTWLDGGLKNRVESVLHAIRTSVDRENTCVVAGGSAALDNSEWLEERGVEKVCRNAQIALNTARKRHGAKRNSAQTAAEITGSRMEPLRRA